MDLNQLFADHQCALISAQRAISASQRDIHAGQAEHYAEEIQQFRSMRGMPRYRWTQAPAFAFEAAR